MNERIKKLAEQVRKHFPKTEMSGEFWVFDEEKFAELIVAECVNILEKPEYAMTHSEELSRYNKGWVNGRLLGIEHIKEHFGV